MEAIILAGGLGTRLRPVVADLPKVMAEVAGKPFLFHVISLLLHQGIERFIFALGYKHEIITRFLKDQFPDLSYKIVVEDEPLGTGGAILLALKQAESANVLVTNGDTLYAIEVLELLPYHQQNQADCTVALKPMKNFDRYGVVELNEDGSIKNFKEKQFFDEGLINGGVYLLNVKSFLEKNFPDKFSFEKDYLEKFCGKRKMFGMVQDHYFIDIGIPEDFSRANSELS